MGTTIFLDTLTTAPALQDARDEYARFTKALNEHTVNRLATPVAVRSVCGLVTHEEGDQAPLIDVIVEIKGPDGKPKIRRTRTDSRGQFRIKNVPVGTYKLKTTMDGFQSVVGTIIVFNRETKNCKGKRARLELRLKPEGPFLPYRRAAATRRADEKRSLKSMPVPKTKAGVDSYAFSEIVNPDLKNNL